MRRTHYVATVVVLMGCSGAKTYDPRLLDAVSGGDRTAAATLIRAGKGINDAYEVSGDTPLSIAAKRGDLGLVKLLLAHGADPSRKNDDEKSADMMTTDPQIKRVIQSAQAH